MEVAPVTIPAHVAIAGRKRKADAQDIHNERLSKRLSLLNLEKNGTKMYVTVENPAGWSDHTTPPPTSTSTSLPRTTLTTLTTTSATPQQVQPPDSPMQLDDDKYKVYIYNIDDELSSDSEPEADQTPGRLIFLPDVEKHLLRTRVPPAVPRPILPNADGELAGKQLVLYSVPSSLSVPEDKDSVRRAILDARARSRARAAVASQQQHPAGPVAVDGRFEVGTPAAVPLRLPIIAEAGTLPRGSILPPAEVDMERGISPVSTVGAMESAQTLLQTNETPNAFPLGTGNPGIGTALLPAGDAADEMELD